MTTQEFIDRERYITRRTAIDAVVSVIIFTLMMLLAVWIA